MRANVITGRLIREARKRAGLTQSELARAVGVQKAAVCRWERAYRAPPHDMLIAVAKALGVRPAALVPTGRELNVS
jgi:transcriptional regulator with XRE-family HTH domain